ncbi:hypothetical protein HPB51_013838 [Rhipicephalus microplus]|uniref:Uncharacterized protein n=1 Tax=Rhipicephalus microplus TaxID=6941 RepID=A0A9J6F306_RHIMP|nr:hypothetical protein HPB51_013838 [Rhipicephalus microplus]
MQPPLPGFHPATCGSATEHRGGAGYFVTFGARNPGSAPSDTSLNVTIMATADHFRKKRGSIRTGVARALALLSDLLQQPDPDASRINGHVDFLKDKEAALSRLDDVIPGGNRTKKTWAMKWKQQASYNEKILYAASRATFWLQEREKATGTQARATRFWPNNHELPHFVEAAGQTSHLLGDHHDKHRVFVILHAEYVSLTDVKNSLRLISSGSGDRKGATAANQRP